MNAWKRFLYKRRLKTAVPQNGQRRRPSTARRRGQENGSHHGKAGRPDGGIYQTPSRGGCCWPWPACSSCSCSSLAPRPWPPLGSGAGGGIGATTYAAKDEDILAAEAAYCDLAAELQAYLDNYESNHSYDEYHFDLDEIEHDPYVLISILSALHEGEWTLCRRGGHAGPTSLTASTFSPRKWWWKPRYRTESRTGQRGQFLHRPSAL